MWKTFYWVSAVHFIVFLVFSFSCIKVAGMALIHKRAKSWCFHTLYETVEMFMRWTCLCLSFRDFLPRGSGIVTRRPLILQLVNSKAGTHSLFTCVSTSGLSLLKACSNWVEMITCGFHNMLRMPCIELWRLNISLIQGLVIGIWRGW